MTKQFTFQKTIYFFFILNWFSFCAQQEPTFTQFWNTKNYFNPAAAGLNYKHQATLLARWQWIGVNGAPDSQLANYSVKLDKLHGGLGVNYSHTSIGIVNQHVVKVNYSYQKKFKNESILSFGMTAGLIDLVRKSSYSIFLLDTTFISGQSQTNLFADFGIAYSKNKLNIGISITQLNKPSHSNDYYLLAPHYYFFADYLFGKSNGLQFKPQVFFRSNLNFYSLNVNASLFFKEKYSLGIGYRNRDAFCFNIGWDIKKKFRLGYSYDLTMSKLNNSVTGGSHEFLLGFLLK